MVGEFKDGLSLRDAKRERDKVPSNTVTRDKVPCKKVTTYKRQKLEIEVPSKEIFTIEKVRIDKVPRDKVTRDKVLTNVTTVPN